MVMPVLLSKVKRGMGEPSLPGGTSNEPGEKWQGRKEAAREGREG